ncbi:MAG: cupin domain-containing protein [Proteobacteria bacterium]|nr:cupin domain-containing protein [Pseudomonadota bacterium]MBU4296922.1 cupin domain-containing protein [Pseudomonadota bacterium]MCG2746086.1 cupin domain-containing protein [Desulfobulbaceae bacterium]
MKKLIYAICFALLFTGNVWALDKADGNGLQVEVLAKSGSSWDGSRLPDYPAGTPEITILRISIPAGAQLPLHEHPVINAGVLLKGELTVITDDHKTLHLKAGDPIVEVVNTWHYGKNEGREPAEILVFYAGVQGRPITEIKPGTE